MRDHNRALRGEYQNKFSLKYLPSWGKLLVGRQVMFELRRLIEQGGLCQVFLELRQLINRHPFYYRSNISLRDKFSIWRRDKSLISYES